jgi:hypothetical protein
MTDQELARALFAAGILTQEQVQHAALQLTPTRNFAQVVVDMGWATPAQITQFNPNALDVGALAGAMPFAPIPDAPSPTSTSSADASPKANTVDNSAINEGWQMVSANLGVWVGAILLAGILIMAFSMISDGIINQIMPAPEFDATSVSDPSNIAGPVIAYFAGLVPSTVVSTLLGIPIQAFFLGGFTIMGLNQLRTGKANLGDLFKAGPHFFPLIILTLFLQIAQFSFFLCCIPGFVVFGLLMFATPLLIERKMNPLEAMSNSWNTLKGQTMAATMVIFLLGLLQIAGALACGIGLLFTLPIWITTEIVLYGRFFPSGALAPQDRDDYPPPPIPSPF